MESLIYREFAESSRKATVPLLLSTFDNAEGGDGFVGVTLDLPDTYREYKKTKKDRIVHEAAKLGGEGQEVLKKLVEKWGVECLTEGYDSGNDMAATTPIHCAALNKETDCTLRWIIDKTCDIEVMKILDDSGCSPTHYVAKYGSESTIKYVFSLLGLPINDTSTAQGEAEDQLGRTNNFWLQPTYNGSNFLHLLSYNRQVNPSVYQGFLVCLGMSESDAEKQVDIRGRSPLFYACLGKNYRLVMESTITGDFVIKRDTECNSLTHKMFQTLANSSHFVELNDDGDLAESEVDNFVACFEHLARCGVDLNAENTSGHTCLQTAEIDLCLLVPVLRRLRQSLTVDTVSQLVTNSSGVHAVHAYSARYELQSEQTEWLQELSRLCQISTDDLIHMRVTDGFNKGATCLHFACGAILTESIRFLLCKGLKLSRETEAGENCFDFAYKRGRLERLFAATKSMGEKTGDLVRSIDPAKRGISLPNWKSARNLLNVFLDWKVAIRTKNLTRGEGHQRECGVAKGGSAEMQLLYRAIRIDSREILAGVLKLYSIDNVGQIDMLGFLRRKQNELGDTIWKMTYPYFDEFYERSGRIFGKISVLDFALYYDRVNILLDACLTAQFDVIPRCLTLLIRLDEKVRLRQGKYEQMDGLRRSVLSVVMNALDHLYNEADNERRQLLFRYLTADFDNGPRFSCHLSDFSVDCCSGGEFRGHSVLELMEMLNDKEVFATDCMSEFTNFAWSSVSITEKRLNPDDILVSIHNRKFCSLRTKFYLHTVAFCVFLIFFGWFITDFQRSSANAASLTIMFLYSTSLTIQELQQMAGGRASVYMSGRGMKQIPKYFAEVVNYVDLTALLVMWIGLVIRVVELTRVEVSEGAVHVCQMLLASSFLLWGTRSVEMLSFFKAVGPMVAMLKGLLVENMVSFLLILFVILYSFGIFFFNLLHPSPRHSEGFGQVLKEVWTLPLQLTFGLFDRDNMIECSRDSNDTIHSTSLCSDSGGLEAFDLAFVYAFLLLVNIVMWNLLIALFASTVEEKQCRAVVIWRYRRYEMLREYQAMGIVPAPLTIVEASVVLLRWAFHFGCSCCHSSPRRQWWLESVNSLYQPNDFSDFLFYQALQLRSCRQNLTRRVEKHRNDLETIMAHAENLAAEASSQSMKTSETLKKQLTSLTEKVEAAVHPQRTTRSVQWPPCRRRRRRQSQQHHQLTSLMTQLQTKLTMLSRQLRQSNTQLN